MTVGDKIRKIRTFRGMTQKELGLAVGFEEKGADNRIAQYETNYRVPKRELLDKIAEALRVDRQNFYTIAPGSAEDFMRTFFWLDEDSPGSIRLFQLVRNPHYTLTQVLMSRIYFAFLLNFILRISLFCAILLAKAVGYYDSRR